MEGFWWILEGKMEASWNPNRSKIDANIETRFFEKTLFFLGKTMILRVQGVEVGSQNRSKIHQKTLSTWEGILTSIFGLFGWIWGAKLGRKIQQKSIQKGVTKTLIFKGAQKGAQIERPRYQRIPADQAGEVLGGSLYSKNI